MATTCQDLPRATVPRGVGSIKAEQWDLAERMFSWVKTRQAGCAFASSLVRNKENQYWRTLVTQIPDDREGRGYLEEILQASTEDSQIHALMVVLQDVELPADLAKLISSLCRHESWSWCEPRSVAPTLGGRERFAIGLRWRRPDGPLCFVLGFGPFGFLPPTRRAPYCALTVPTCETGFRRTDSSDERHLCDMRNDAFTDETWANLSEETRVWRKALIGEHDEKAAKARVTFVLPEELRAELPGLAPQT